METSLSQVLRLRSALHLSRLASDLRRAAVGAAFATVAGVMALAATGCAVAALWLLLAPRIGAPGAALSAAALLLALSGLALGLRVLTAQRRAVPEPLAPATAPDLTEAAMQAFGANKMELLLAALIAGAATAESLRAK